MNVSCELSIGTHAYVHAT